MTEDYSVFLHFTTSDDPVPLAQADTSPARPSRPTSTWDDPGETLIGQLITITIPEDTSPGEYLLRIGIYNPRTGARLSREDGTETFELALTIE